MYIITKGNKAHFGFTKAELVYRTCIFTLRKRYLTVKTEGKKQEQFYITEGHTEDDILREAVNVMFENLKNHGYKLFKEI